MKVLHLKRMDIWADSHMLLANILFIIVPVSGRNRMKDRAHCGMPAGKCGWQMQKNSVSVQQKLEKRSKKHWARNAGRGRRTLDARVHALRQVRTLTRRPISAG